MLTLLTRGRTNAQIAGALMIAPGTVRTHVEHVLAKLGAASRTEAAVIAVTEGLVIRHLTDCAPAPGRRPSPPWNSTD